MMPSSSLRLFEQGLEQLELSLTDVQLDQINDYLRVLMQWNQTFNLTAIRNYDDIVVHHLLDSFVVHPFIHAHATAPALCVDIGSGAGVPGIPLAILNPSIAWTLVDSNGKKARFLKHVQREADLKNVTVWQKRIEQLDLSAQERRPLLITARALAEAGKVLHLIRPFVLPGDRILLMKGLKGEQEAQSHAPGFSPFEVHTVTVPFLKAQRCILSTQVLADS